MVFSPEKRNNAADGLQQVMNSYQDLTTDEKLGLLWIVYDNMGGSITPAAPGATESQFTTRLVARIKAMEPQDQLDIMRDLINKKNNSVTQAYSAYTKDNKLVFWYELGQLMRTGEVIPVPEAYELPAKAAQVFNQIVLMDFNEQITLLRHAVMEMGPLS